MIIRHTIRCTLIVFVVALMVFPFRAQAQIFDEFGAVVPPEGPKGRYTREQIAPLALQLMPGEIIGGGMYRNHNLTFQEFLIQTLDGSVYELEYETLKAELSIVNVRKLSNNPIYPPGLYEKQAVNDIAKNHIQHKTMGKLKAKITKNKGVELYKRKLAYLVDVRKGAKKYSVYVDALTAKILDLKER